MDKDKQIYLSALFDGELPEAETKAARERLGEDPGGRAFMARLEGLRAGSSEAHRTTVRPDWVSVQNRLKRGDPALTRWNRLTYTFLSGLVAIAIFGLLLIGPRNPETGRGLLLVDRVEMVETDLEGATPVVFLDEPSGWTVVWVLEKELPKEG
ncbi:MAG TPA: hypothetical protein VJ960_00170 [Oceanipulchritudo sp.]|nr:hypothetical protein [Oceanipulchritudo sp.]